ncbi:unnamed protein product [Cyclocybe aegerita]|uniref:F-box domain-containing protein n=1 Tax=Cyclocybe aegerita TaxID=1973307 RepID=A0A8S0WCM4_CYCAE|nr:unnamed protein product [Cyclocybe aegerita]
MSSTPCIVRVPPELLCQIFAATLPSSEDPDISPNSGAYLLTQVCQEWRHVAITDPRLWAAFKVSLRPSTSPTRVHAVILFLTRSASQPLSISLVAPDQFKQFDPDTRKLATSIIHLLTKHASRWSRISLVLPSSSTLFASLSTFPAPELTRLSLDLGNWTYEEASNINNLLMRAPALRHFSWSNRASWGSWDAVFDTGVEKLRAPWHALTNILLDTHVTFKVALAVLPGRDQIATISSEDPLKARIHLPYLERLSIFQHTLDDGLSTLLTKSNGPNHYAASNLSS